MAAKKKKAAKKKAPKRKAAKKKAAKRTTKKKATKRRKPARVSLEVKDRGATADKAGHLYEGQIVKGNTRIDVGVVVARSKASARSKLRNIARLLLK